MLPLDEDTIKSLIHYSKPSNFEKTIEILGKHGLYKYIDMVDNF